MTETEQYTDAIGVTTLEADAKDQFPEKSPWKINGIALPENTVVNGGQGVNHYYPPEMAQRAAEVMQQQIDDENDKVHLVSGFHELEGQADPEQIVGEITAAGYEKGTGVVFEGETISEDVADRIAHGYVEVSPTIARSLGEYSDEMGAQAVDRVTGFRDVAIVGNGQKGVDVSVGPNPAVEALAMETLSQGFKPTHDPLESDMKTVSGVSFQGTRDGKLDESEIDDNFGDHALYGDGENKEDYSYWVVDADGFLRKGNVESAWELGCRGQCPGDDEHDSNLMNLADEFENPPEFAQEETDTNSDEPDPDEPEGEDTVTVVESVPVEENPNEVTIVD